jgi:SprT-like protein
MARQLTFSDSTDQRTLTESANTVTDDTPEGDTQQHAADIAAEYFSGRLGLPLEGEE